MSHRRRSGFTLAELIVILLIIFILASLAIPATRKVREPANRMVCQSNMRQIMIAMQFYHEDSGRTYSTKFFPKGCTGPGDTPEERLSWMVSILPYLESDSVHKNINQEKNYAGNHQALNVKLKVYQCVSADAPAVPVTHYVAMAGVGLDAAIRPLGSPGIGLMGYDRQTSLAKIIAGDGTSNTIGMMETRFDIGHWARGGFTTLRGYDPATMKLEGDHPAFSGHSNGTNAVMVDGSVQQIHKSIDPKVLSALITIAGGERVNISTFDMD